MVAAKGATAEEVDLSGPNLEHEEGEDSFVDLGQYNEDQQYPVLTRGNYNVRVDQVEYGISQSGGNPMFTWQFVVVDGQFKDSRLFFHTTFTPAAMPRVKKALRVLCPELLEKPFKPSEVADSGLLDRLVGNRCRVKVGIRRYKPPGEEKARPTNNVDAVMSMTAGGEGDSSFLDT